MKKQRLPLILSCLSVLCLAGCKNKNAEMINVFDYDVNYEFIEGEIVHEKELFTLSKYNFSLKPGESQRIKASTIPTSYISGVTFASKNPQIAKVDATGKITGVSKGFTEIEVKSNDGIINEIINVMVNETINEDTAVSILNGMYKTHKDGTTKKSEKIWVHETVTQDISKNDEVYNHVYFLEDIKFSPQDAFFEIYSEDLEIKTRGGSPTISSGRWIFFVDKSSYVTYLVHETASAKRYFEIKTQKYLEDERPASDIIYDVLDMFFVAGREIIDDMVDEAYGDEMLNPESKSGFADLITNAYSNVTYSLAAASNKDLYVEYTVTFDDTVVEGKEEYDTGIPAGTHCYQEMSEFYLLKDNVVLGDGYVALTSYEDGDDSYAMVFTKEERYDREFEISIPDLTENYQKVDEMYDL